MKSQTIPCILVPHTGPSSHKLTKLTLLERAGVLNWPNQPSYLHYLEGGVGWGRGARDQGGSRLCLHAYVFQTKTDLQGLSTLKQHLNRYLEECTKKL